jgi:hypothetical protein
LKGAFENQWLKTVDTYVLIPESSRVLVGARHVCECRPPEAEKLELTIPIKVQPRIILLARFFLLQISLAIKLIRLERSTEWN